MSQESKVNRSTQALYYIGALVCFAVIVAFVVTAKPKNAEIEDTRRVNQAAPDHSSHMDEEPAPPEASVNVGDVMPDFTLTNVNAKPGESKEWRLSDNDGQYTLIFVADTKCACVSAYTERVQKFYKEYQSKGVRMAFLYPQPDETEDIIRQSMRQRGYTWPGLKDDDQHLLQQLNIKCTTEAYLLDPANRLLYRGAFDDNTFKPEEVKEHLLKTALESAMADKPILTKETPVKACIITRLANQSEA